MHLQRSELRQELPKTQVAEPGRVRPGSPLREGPAGEVHQAAARAAAPHGAGLARLLGAAVPATPCRPPHAIWAVLKAGETAYSLWN